MSSDSGLPRATVTPPSGSPVNGPVRRTVTSYSAGAVIGGIAILFLGLALGLANQAADDTDMTLRIPALLAALLMVGQGIMDLRRGLPQQRVEVLPAGESDGRGSDVAIRSTPVAQPVTVLATRPSPATLTVPLSIMFLAAWLGLADLRVAAPQTLSVLSLVSAFALFAIGWGLLPARR